jgi:S1-C subfamily serine protease
MSANGWWRLAARWVSSNGDRRHHQRQGRLAGTANAVRRARIRQTDAKINPGNLGAARQPRGQVVGVNTLIQAGAARMACDSVNEVRRVAQPSSGRARPLSVNRPAADRRGI